MRYVIYGLLSLPLVAYAAYFTILGMMTFLKRESPIKRVKACKRFAVIIPARNEEAVIANLIASLKAQRYPGWLYTIFVAANNCTDQTAQVSEALGATLLPIEGEIHSKGDVMIQALAAVKASGEYDAALIFDADNLVHRDFFQQMNDALCAGFHVAEGNRDSKNPEDTWISCNASIYYWLFNSFIHKARMKIGASAILNGTGMMISMEALDRVPYQIKTLTEDIEYSTLCALAGERIAFVEGARFYDEQPCDLSFSLKQRHRWSVGCCQCASHYGKALIKRIAQQPSTACFDLLFTALAPAVQVALFILSGVMAVDMCLGLYPSVISGLFVMLFGLVSGAMAYVAQVCMAAWGAFLQRKQIRRFFPAALLFPVYIMTWIPVNIMCLLYPKTTWEPIKHDRAVTLENMNGGSKANV